MKEYTVAYIRNGQDYGHRTFIAGITISEILEEVTYELNRYGKDFDEIALFDLNDEEEALYYKVVNIDGKYKLQA